VKKPSFVESYWDIPREGMKTPDIHKESLDKIICAQINIWEIGGAD
jgi:hypothetical protein